MRTGVLAAALAILTVSVASQAAAHARSITQARDATFVAACGPGGEADTLRARRNEKVRDDVHRAALARVAPDHSLDEGVRDEVLARVAPMRRAVESELDELVATSSRWVASSDDAPAGALDRLASARLVWPTDADLRRGCGEDLLVDDAWVDKAATSIAICPGFLLASVGEGSLDDRIAFLLAHEIGHVVAGPAAQGRDSERASEVFADRWAAQLLDARLSAIAPAERAAVVRATLEPICGPATDPVHPSGRERIAIVAEMPQVAAALAVHATSAPTS